MNTEKKQHAWHEPERKPVHEDKGDKRYLFTWTEEPRREQSSTGLKTQVSRNEQIKC